MPVSLTLVNTGDKIKAEDLNNLADYYNEIWRGDIGVYSFDATHHTDTDRRFGWGQPLFEYSQDNPLIDAKASNNYVGSLIEATDINEIVAKMNAGLYHTEDDPISSSTVEGLQPLINPASNPPTKVLTAYHNQVVNKIQWFRAAPKNKYQLDWANFDLAVLSTTTSTSWDEDLEIVHKFSFDTYDKARHFFNAGGELTLELTMAPGGNAGNMVWEEIFDQFDSIRIGAEGCRVVADNIFDVIATSGVNYGFYNGLEYLYGGGPTPGEADFKTILDAGVFAYTKTGSTEYAAVYLYSEYNSRRIRIQMRAVDTGSSFDIYVRVILIEDVEDVFSITQPITLDSGYVQPATTPLASDGNKSYMTVDSQPYYRFTEIDAPTITLDTDWQQPAVDQTYTQLDWEGHYILNVDAGNFINGQEYTIVSVNDNITVDRVITGKQYKIISAGTTDFTKMGAANNNVGTTFPALRLGEGTGIVGGATSTDTDFTLIGAGDNNPGTVFTATGPGTGSGIASETKTPANADPGQIWQSMGYASRYKRI